MVHNNKKSVLIVDDDLVILKILEENLRLKLKNVNIIAVPSYHEAVKNILDENNTIAVAILDLTLPDVQYCAIVEFALGKGIPSIVLSSTIDQDLKSVLLKNKVLEYIVKDGRNGIERAIQRVERELKNQDRSILVVDDSPLQLAITVNMLEKVRLKNIVTATNGMEAYGILVNSDIDFSLVLTDFNMPKMDGMDLTLKIREKFDKDELSVIVISANDMSNLSSQFISVGANDFLNKPYNEIDLITRITSNLELLNLFEKTKDMANRDFLTGAYNRRYFYEMGQNIFLKALRAEKNLALAMIDIDRFKNINDNYGHTVGDEVIIKVIHILNDALKSSDLVARFGGEEFCVLLEDISMKDVETLFDKIRQIFTDIEMIIEDYNINFTVSIGIFYGLDSTLENMIKKADKGLYFCKKNGRNQIAINKED